MLTFRSFLPSTVAFHDPPKTERRPSPPAALQSRKSSVIDIPTRASQASLFSGPTPPLTPNTLINQEFFAGTFGPESQKQLFARPGDPRSMIRNDAHVPEWGAQAIFNQPRSRAGPLPSGSILDFAQVAEELAERKRLAARKKQRSSPQAHASRNTSSDRGYEGKTWTVEPAVQGNGGLTNAMRQAADAGELEINWIGTIGFPTDALPETTKEDIHDHLHNDYESEVVYVSDKDLDGHYAHYCKTILWPICSYQVPDHPKSKAYADHSWEFYRNVNQAFADKIVANYKADDTIWIHDYHLFLVPGMVRKKLPNAKIGFFLHTAFPSSEVFRCLSTRKALLEGILGANLVAFQTDEYAGHFLQTASRLLTVETTAEGVQLDDHFVNVTSEPIGINPAAVQEARQELAVAKWIKVLQEKYQGKQVLVARDKLDNVRGVRQKLLAYELFLNKYPEWRGKVVLVQVATSTSEQSELLTTVSDICTRIDSVHSTLAHQPLVFLKQDIDFSQYLALLTIADVLIISALRDGMNLTGHEFVCCQDGTASDKKHGPLILSEFTGSAAVFGRKHISINPWNYQEQADAIKQALEMQAPEKAHRWAGLHDTVMRQTGGHWISQLSERLTRVYEEHRSRAQTSVPRLNTQQLSAKYTSAERRVFILDYEGTLAPHRTSTGIPLSSPQRMLDTLMDLMGDARNIVYVMSGRRPEELEGTFRTLPALGLIAENGCFLREFGSSNNEWQEFLDPQETAKWKSDVKGILKYYKDRLDGSEIEERRCSLLFRYDKAEDQDAAIRQAGESTDQINGACKNMRIHAVPINKAVLIEQTDFTKSTAATRIFDELRERNVSRGYRTPDFMLVAGDDREDEVIFHWANDLGKQGVIRDVFTISVGKRNTEAQATLTQGSTGLLTALQKLAKISSDSIPMDYFNTKQRAQIPT